MKPGRELDALVAKKVMGWTKHRRAAGEDVDYSFNWVPPEFRGDVAYWRPLPRYSEDIAAAWVVVSKLPCAHLAVEWRDGRGWEAWFAIWDSVKQDADVYEGLGDTAPHAICLAALKAVGAL